MIREFDQTLTGTFYVSYLGVAENSNIRRFALNLGEVSGGSFSYAVSNWIGQINSALGLCVPSAPTNEPLWGVANSWNCAYSTVSATELSLIVAAVNIDTGLMDLYVLDPDAAYPTSMPSTPDASYDCGVSLGTINGIRYWLGSGSSSSCATASIDELRVGTTWSDVVVPVPEPSTLALFATSLIGLLAYAWRKRK